MMKPSANLRLLLSLSLSVYVFSFSAALAQNKAPAAETKAAAAIQAAADPAAKMTAASDFVKKYPKSSLMPQVADHLVAQLGMTNDPTAKAKLAGEMQTLFETTDQSAKVSRSVVDAYLAANKFDEAFALGEKVLKSNPEDIVVLGQLTNASAEAVKKQNGKFVAIGLQHGPKVIELIEAKKKPLAMSEAVWNTQVELLPRLYQDVGLLYLVSKDLPKAKAAYERAITLAPDDPMNHAMIASVLDEEYMAGAKAYQEAPAAQKQTLLKKVNDQLDLVIEAYAKAIAIAATRPEYQPLANQARQNLEPYYKYRHNNSTEGMEKLIEKYKPVAKTP